jgi:eukaryotic-like serine/threonine-protein kinase
MTPETKSEMTPERYRQVQRALEQALECAESERAAYLDAACGADAALRREVESLLAADAHAASFIESPAVARRAVPEGAESIAGLRLGAYRVVGELGRGGMGAVYLAVRADDLFEKRVAVKLVKRGMDTDEIVRRFEHERQILAALEHPNVARLIDAGATADGRPYFVMEYVEGVPIDEYCERRELGVRERLELFRKVSAAVEYAHRHFIVHRDLKPSNILIGADGEPKLLDFGIAKLVQEGAAEGTLTAAGLRPMTPEYASPEQARGLTVTAASDVYSLGVVLYELLTRQRPYELKSRTPDEMLGVICREEPEKPSLAVARGGRSEKLRRQLSGDLDNIVLTALRKEPERRYRSVEQLSEDIRRHLDGLPVTARHDTFGYRSGKFVRRHKVGVAAASVIAVTLLGGIVATAWQARVARAERDKAAQVSNFLTGIFQVNDPGVERANSVTARELLDRGAERIERELNEQPETQAAMLHTIGTVYHNIGLYERAAALHQRALDVRRQALGEEHAETADSHLALGSALMIYNLHDSEAEPHCREALRIYRARFGPESLQTAAALYQLADITRFAKRDLKAAEPLYREALAIRRQRLPQPHYDTAVITLRLAGLLSQRGELNDAAPLAREALGMMSQLFPPDDYRVGDACHANGVILYRQGDYAAAAPLFRRGLASFRKAWPGGHVYLANGLLWSGMTELKLGQPKAAEALLRECLAVRRKIFAPDSAGIADAESVLGEALADQRRFADAGPLLTRGYQRLDAEFGAGDRLTQAALRRLVDFHAARGEPDKAAEYQSLMLKGGDKAQ